MKTALLLLLLATTAQARPLEPFNPVLIHLTAGQGNRINVYFWVFTRLPIFA
jgi:hypothetical protein